MFKYVRLDYTTLLTADEALKFVLKGHKAKDKPSKDLLNAINEEISKIFLTCID